MKVLRALTVAVLVLFARQADATTYRLRYDAQVLGVVTLGQASFEVSTSGGRYRTRATMRTSGIAQFFDRTQISAASTGLLRPAGLSWSSYNLSHAYAQQVRHIDMRRTRTGVTANVAPRFGDMGDPPATPAQRNGSYDPLTAIFALGRQIGASQSCAGRVAVFDGRAHYRLIASGRAAPVMYRGGGYEGPAVRCALRYEPIAGYTSARERRFAPPRAEAWFALPSDRSFGPLLRLQVQTAVGQARLNLRGYEQG